MVCGACNKKLKGKTGGEGDDVICSKCSTNYHSHCLKLTREESKLIKSNSNKYVCASCKTVKPVTKKEEKKEAPCTTPPQTQSESVEPDLNEENAATAFVSSAQNLASMAVPSEVLSAFTTALLQLQRVFENMKREMNDFTASLNHTSEEITEFRNEISEMKAQVKELDFYKSEVKNLRAEVVELRQELDSKEQRQLLKNVEITGITENNGENLQQVISTMCNKLGVQLDPRDVDDVRRVGLRGAGAGTGGAERPRPVVLTLTRRAPRDQILRAAKVRRGLTTDMLEIPGNPRRVYINEHLTKINRVLFSKARAAGAQLKFKFVWSSNGSIYMRRSETSSVVRVSSESVLDKLCKDPAPPVAQNSQPGPFQDSSI